MKKGMNAVFFYSIFDIRYSIFDIRYSIFDIRYSIFDILFIHQIQKLTRLESRVLLCFLFTISVAGAFWFIVY